MKTNKLSWKDVFNAYKLYPQDFYSCLEYLSETDYKYIAFNGRVYKIDDFNIQNPICLEEELE